MVRTLLICGLIAGLLAGVAAFGFQTVAGEPAVDEAIAFEEANAPPLAPGEVAEPELVSRSAQKSVGLLTASVVYGLALGGIFALVFAVGYGRIGQGRLTPGRTALVLAAVAFAVVYLVPFVKYPPNPPAVGDPDTIGERTALFVTMIWISIAAAVAGWRLRRVLARRLSGEIATFLGVCAYLALVAAAGVALPGKNELPESFPADTLWRFRAASVGTQAVIWTAIGAVFAYLAQRVMAGQTLSAVLRGRGRMTSAWD